MLLELRDIPLVGARFTQAIVFGLFMAGTWDQGIVF
jgi:hypothetical protein